MREEAFNKPTRWPFSSSLISQLSSFIIHLSTFLLTSCSEVLYLGIEQLVPPEAALELQVRSVGVVNNFSRHNVVMGDEQMIVLPLDADSVREEVALAFANGGLDRVVVMDTLLYPTGSQVPHHLTYHEAAALCREMEVEALYAIDYACLTFYPSARYTGQPVYAWLCSHIYTPRADSMALVSVPCKEMLEHWTNGTTDIARLFPHMPHQLADAAVTAHLPAWKERERVFYYDRLCYELREAKVYVYEGNWKAAAEQWRTLTESRHRPQRFMARYNLALYHEMTDDIDGAIAALDLALEEAAKTNRRGKTSPLIDTTYAHQYREVLITRKEEIKRLEGGGL